MKVKDLILEYFVPALYQEFLETHAQWDDEIDQWRLPALEFAGNNIAVQNMESGSEISSRPSTAASTSMRKVRPVSQRRVSELVRGMGLRPMADPLDFVDGGWDPEDPMSVMPPVTPDMQQAVHAALEADDVPINTEDAYYTYGPKHLAKLKRSSNRRSKRKGKRKSLT